MISPNWRDTPNSSQVAGFGYDQASRILTVKFNTGAVYDYMEVPDTVFDGMRAAQSTGSYFIKNVKRAGYTFKRRP